MNFGELLTYARQRLGIENNGAIQDSELATMLNLGLGSLDETLCTNYEDYNLTRFLATVGGAQGGNGPNNFIPLPKDFFKLRAVDFGTQGAWITLYGFGLQQRNYYQNPYSAMFAPYVNQAARRVRVMDKQIYIEPQTLAAGQYQVWYTPKFTWLVNNDDSLPDAMDTDGFIEYAIAATGEKVYTKLLLDTSKFAAEMQYYEDKVRNSARNRMSNGPQCVQNVRNYGSVWGFGHWGRGY